MGPVEKNKYGTLLSGAVLRIVRDSKRKTVKKNLVCHLPVQNKVQKFGTNGVPTALIFDDKIDCQ